MRNDVWREYQRNLRKFDGWLRANFVLGSILVIGMLAIALAGHREPEGATELSSVTASPIKGVGQNAKNLPVQTFQDMSLVFPGDP